MEQSYIKPSAETTGRTWLTHAEHEEKTKIWDSSSFKYSLISFVALAALACIVLGAIAYSEAGLDVIGTTGGIALMATGVGIFAVGIVARFLCRNGSCTLLTQYPRLSTPEAISYGKNLPSSQFFVFEDAHTSTKMMLLNHPAGDMETYPTFYDVNYSDYKEKYTEVTLEQLKSQPLPLK